MGISAALEVCIGLLFMYLVLSLVCTTIHEIIASMLRLRARSLTNTLRALIDDQSINARFFNHGLVVSAEVSSRAGTVPPTLASASPATNNVLQQPAEGDYSSYLNGKNFALALLDSVMPADPSKPFPPIADIEAAITKLPDSNIRDVLLSCLATAKTDVVALQENVATWFDSAMGRLSGQYTRHAQRISLAIGLVFAVGLGADSYGIGKALWQDSGLRAEVADAAKEFIQNPPPSALEQCKNEDQAMEQECLRDVFNAQMERLRAFPIGWAEWPRFDLPSLLKLLGCLWTGFALSLGAPFWFDLLQKFMKVRGAGTKSE